MLFALKLALKFLSIGRSGLARFTAFLALSGMAIGVAGMIAAQAVTNGFHNELKAKLLAGSPHIKVSRTDGKKIEDAENIRFQILDNNGVEDAKAFASKPAMLVGKDDTGFVLLQTHDDKQRELSGRIEIGTKLAERLGLVSGSQADLMLLNPDGDVRRVRIFIDNIFSTGLYDLDSGVVRASPAEFAAITGHEDTFPLSFEVWLSDGENAGEMVKTIAARLGKEYEAASWNETNRAFFEAIDLERRISFIVLSIIALIAASSIAATITLLVSERQHDIAVLRTMGASAGKVVSIFLIQALFLGLAGVSAGAAAGFGLCYAINYFDLAAVSPEVYQISRFRAVPLLENILLIAASALALSLVAGFYPAFSASRIKPLITLRRQ